MAHTKSGGTTSLGRDSRSKRLGVKANHGQPVHPGEIIIRQHGTHYIPGKNVKRAADDTLFAKVGGTVQFYRKSKIDFDGEKNKRVFVKVVTAQSTENRK